MATETRLGRVEEELAVVRERLRRLEDGREEAAAPGPALPALAASSPSPSPSAPPAPAPPALASPSPSASAPPAPLSPRGQRPAEPRVGATAPRPAATNALDFELLFGGRVLAWIGGLAILFAAVLFVAMAIGRGWIDEEARTIVAALGSLGLLLGGIWLHERQGRTEAARAAVAAALSGLYATILVATQAYDLVSPGLGLFLAAAVAVTGFALAVRWDAPVIAAVGSLGALAAPQLTGVGIDGTGLAFVAVALAATVLILLWRRWDWLALGAFVVSAPQLLAWAHLHAAAFGPAAVDVGLILPVLAGFWMLYALAAVGYALRVRDDRTDPPLASWTLLLGAGALVVGLGYQVLERADAHTAGVVWLFGFAGVHLLLGELAIRARVHREVGALLVGLGIAVTAFGLAQALDGPALVVAWAAEAAILAALSTRVDATPDPALSSRRRLFFAAAGFLALAALHTLAVEAHPAALFEGVDDLGAALGAIAACAAGALALAWFARREDPAAARAASFAGAAALVYLGSVAIVDTLGVDSSGDVVQAGQTWLSAFWTVTGLGAIVWGLVRREGSVRLGGLALLGIAIAKVWTYDLAELEELARVLSFVGLGLLLLAGSFAYQRIKPAPDEPEPAPPMNG